MSCLPFQRVGWEKNQKFGNDKADILIFCQKVGSDGQARGQGFEPQISDPESDVLPIKLSPNNC
jgi:hypothetical protein